MVRRILGVLFIGGLLLVLLVVGVWIAFQPPILEVPSQRRLVFSNVTVVNPDRDRRVRQTLTVQDDRIESVIPYDSARGASGAPGGFAGSYVLPGLIDMHVHHGSWVGDRELFGLLFLAHGVTAVRNTGVLFGTTLDEKRQIRAGKYPGPRLFTCGPILDGDPPLWPAFLPGSWSVRTAAEARATVEELAKLGVDCVKVYSLLPPQALVAIREEAARHGLPVIGHVPLAVPFEEAHLQDVQHLTGVPPVVERMNVTQQTYGAVVATAWRNLDPARVDFVVRTSVEQGITHTPTLVVYKHVSRELDYSHLLRDPTAHLLPRWYREVMWQQEGALRVLAALSEPAPRMTTVVRRLNEAGVRILVGTDTPNPFTVPGASLHEELHHLIEAGFTPEETWVAATRWAGESLGEPKLGTLEEGAPADLLIFREDPSHDLAALSTLEAVVAQGRLYPKEVLDLAIRRHRDYFEGWLYDRISMALARMTFWLLGWSSESPNDAGVSPGAPAAQQGAEAVDREPEVRGGEPW